eukprot:13286732-Alexandrium_andersonii.AAC.1
MLGSSVPKDPRSAPSEADFQSVIADRSKHASFDAAAKDGCAGIEKRTKTLRALAEKSAELRTELSAEGGARGL